MVAYGADVGCPHYFEIAGVCNRTHDHVGLCYNPSSQRDYVQCLRHGIFPSYSCPPAVPAKCRFEVCNADSTGSCWLFACDKTRGPTMCVDSKCICKPNHCNKGGKCVKDWVDLASELPGATNTGAAITATVAALAVLTAGSAVTLLAIKYRRTTLAEPLLMQAAAIDFKASI
eukprot:NODE_21709_length_740_cov_4.680261.p2 GENE.NODE_21709_length_740_cov_4.680261~~NODE_21709_length_740_cov_4.680261.p2  ORF type:complete len:182 (-),score=35.66 NODE_21709_length_740_cov_4.680261:195-713(-)